MEPSLRDPVWQFVGVVVAVIAIVVAVAVPWILFRKQRKKKALEYRVLTSTPVFRNPVGSGKFELLFEKQPVENVQLIIVRIVNTGDVEINPIDYHDHIAVEFSPDARILSAELIQTSPADLTTGARISANRVVFPPVLLNAGDWFTVQCLVAYFKEEIKVSGRISGVKQIRVHPSPNLRTIMSGLAGTFAGMLAGIIFLSFKRTEIAGYVSLAAACASTVATVAYLRYGERRQTKLFG